MKKMMKNVLKTLAALSVFLFTSCAATRPIAVTSNPVGNKCGEATTVKILGIFGTSSNNGINAAAKKGGITKISHVDYNTKNYILWSTQTTRVYGE